MRDGAEAGSRRRILVVDDEESLGGLIKDVLGREYDVRTALRGDQALAMFDELPADLVLADQRMPGMTGVELLAAIHQRDPDCVRILMTAYADPDAMIGAINRGEVYRFIFKPWNVVDMRTELRLALERRDLVLSNRGLVEELRRRNLELERSIGDLTETRDRLLRAEKLALVGRFATGFTHDIRNRLSCMVDVRQFADRHPEDELLRELLDDVEQAGDDLRCMVDEFGALGRGEVPRYSMVVAQLRDVVAGAVRFACNHEDLRSRRIELDAGEVPPFSMAPDGLRRVIVNLLYNAAEATPAGTSIALRVFTDGDDACLSVTDQGEPIPEALRERIFEPFFTTKKHGTGLGLDVCRTIVGGHGGTLVLEPRQAAGNTFTVRLPVR